MMTKRGGKMLGVLVAITLMGGCDGGGEGEYEIAISGSIQAPFPAFVVPQKRTLSLGEEDGLVRLSIDGAEPFSFEARPLADGWRVGFPTTIGLDTIFAVDCARPIPVLGWVSIDLVGEHGEGTFEGSLACGDAAADVVFQVSGDAL